VGQGLSDPSGAQRRKRKAAAVDTSTPIESESRAAVSIAPSVGVVGNPLRLPKAGEMIASNLRNRIVRGQLAEGEMLPSERELVQQFGTSRPTLREAIRILESERLVSVSRGLHGGARVRKPSAEVASRYVELILQARGISLADVYKTLVIIEPAAARMLAVERRPEAVSALRACIEEVRAAGKTSENGLAFSRFHHVLVEQTRVDTLILLMGMLNAVLDHYLVAVSAVLGQYVEKDAEVARAIKTCERLINFIEQGDSDAAAELWRSYLQAAERKLREWQPAELVVDLLQS
jgi:DNA-binding FadR family transcriptional regulator